MLVYWTMYALPAFYTLLLGTTDPRRQRSRIGMSVLLFAFAVLVGLRYQVGTDWYNYLRTINQISYFTLAQSIAYKDPGFGLLTWISTRLGLGIYGANVFCGAALMLGISRFARRQPDAWLALTSAVPYLVVVVGMGYVRQAAAIGFILVAISNFEDRRYVRFLGWIVLAALFHGPSAVILPLAAFALTWERRELAIPMAFIFALLFAFLLERRVSTFFSIYIDAEYSSSGAAIRLVMNAIPAVIFILLRRRFGLDNRSMLLWIEFSIISILLLLIFPIFPSSTALDRVSLYFIPIQMYVFGRLPLAFGNTSAGRRIIAYIAVLYYGAAMFVWLFFASNAHNWLPYRFVLLSS